MKTAIVVFLILAFIFSYSIFFINFSRPQPEPEFLGPESSPPSDFKEPTGPPSIEEPAKGPPG